MASTSRAVGLSVGNLASARSRSRSVRVAAPRSVQGSAARLCTSGISLSGRPRRQITSMGLFGLGAPELVVIAGVTALLFGPSKIAASLPEVGRGLGKTVKSVKAAAEEFKDEMNAAATEGDEPTAEAPKAETPKAEAPKAEAPAASKPPSDSK